MLQRIFAWAILLSILASFGVAYLYFDNHRREAARKVIYIKARALAAEQQRERTLNWRRRHREQQLSQQFQEGRVVNAVLPASAKKAPAK